MKYWNGIWIGLLFAGAAFGQGSIESQQRCDYDGALNAVRAQLMAQPVGIPSGEMFHRIFEQMLVEGTVCLAQEEHSVNAGLPRTPQDGEETGSGSLAVPDDEVGTRLESLIRWHQEATRIITGRHQ